MGKGDIEQSTTVVQTNQQTQEVNVNAQTKTLSDTINGLVDVLKTQAANPASYVPVTIVSNPGTQQNSSYDNSNTNGLLEAIFLNTLSGQQNVAKNPDLPDKTMTIFIAAAIVIIVVMISRR